MYLPGIFRVVTRRLSLGAGVKTVVERAGGCDAFLGLHNG